MVLLGRSMRLLDNTPAVRANPHATMLVLLMFPSVVKGEQGWIPLSSGILSAHTIWAMAVLLTLRPTGQR